MKKGNLLKKSINLALSVFVAGAIIAVGADGSAMAAITGNDAIISNIVEAAEVTQIPWSTAYVYGLLPIDLSTGGQGGARDGSTVTMDYTAGVNKDWTARFTTAVTADGQVLQFQYLEPKGVLGYGAAGDGFYMFCDSTQLKKLSVFKESLSLHQHLWEYTKDETMAEYTAANYFNAGVVYYDTVDEGLYYRTTISYNTTSYEGVPLTGILSAIEVKATGEIYGFKYTEPTATYNDILAKEIIYSCVPTKLQ